MNKNKQTKKGILQAFKFMMEKIIVQQFDIWYKVIFVMYMFAMQLEYLT